MAKRHAVTIVSVDGVDYPVRKVSLGLSEEQQVAELSAEGDTYATKVPVGAISLNNISVTVLLSPGKTAPRCGGGVKTLAIKAGWSDGDTITPETVVEGGIKANLVKVTVPEIETGGNRVPEAVLEFAPVGGDAPTAPTA